MKNVLGCEGKAELLLLNKLLSQGQLVFNKKELLDMRPLHFRQPKDISALIDILPFNEEIVFYRVGDTQHDEYDLKCFEARESYIKIIKVCTTPEIEMLIIINEKMFDKFQKFKSTMSPKEFVKTFVKGWTGFNDYILNHDMVWAINEYKKLVKLKNKEDLYLADLLKKDI